jgi:YD repeat-containing protein
LYDGSDKLHNRNVYKYNEKEKLTEEARYERDNELESKTVYEYDKSGPVVSEMTRREDGEVLKNKKYRYDKAGNLTEETSYSSSGMPEVRITYAYDKMNNKTEEIRYNAAAQEMKTVYTYTAGNKKKSEAHIYPYEKSNSRIEWNYDEAGHMISETVYDYQNKTMQKSSATYKDGKLVKEEKNNSVTEYKYDSLGRMSEERTLNGEALLSEKKFDAKGNVVLWNHYSSGALSFSEASDYDSTHTFLQHMTKRDKHNNVVEESYYDWDAKGNKKEELVKTGYGSIQLHRIYTYEYYPK